MTPLIDLTNIQVHFTVDRRTLTRRGKRQPRHRGRRDPRARRRERQRQEHARQRRRRPADTDRRHHARSAASPSTRHVRRQAQRAIQIVFQDPFGALDPRMPVSSIITEPLRIARIGTAAERQSRARDLVDQVGLPLDALNRYPHEFSGGQRQRIAIARALAPEPDADRRRRAALGAGRVDPEPDPEPAARAAAAAQPRLPVHQPRPRGGEPPRRPRRRALSRPPGRGRAARRAVRHTVPPLHPGAAAGRAAHRPPRVAGRSAIHGEMPSPLDPPPGCVFHPRCPKAQDDLPRRAAARWNRRRAGPRQFAACHFKRHDPLHPPPLRPGGARAAGHVASSSTA